MIYHFKIQSQESTDFHLEIQLDEKHTFFDFHKTIQNCLGFESYQLASFFISDKMWRKQKEISMLDLGFNGAAYFIMQKTKLSELINSKEQKLIYTFDFFNDRSFYIELTGIIMERNLNEPLVTLKEGKSPVQILGNETNERELSTIREEEVYMDFGELEDYTEIFGEMDDF
ncbi:plasmid pRiA4b ORF-3 family protein [Maribellus maritimus]|uniref:plasmid pRiA4b ORF-3 family protein n=1 Tax=Maribellus maritimus TaxID=2870838 RepID=UPI001EEAF215|nr:plasmid pRiA4b ORF-3 family protein [Maribellus maritimus]MCG6185847.1 plasmid pRiA4b ORF-3 family protein [Maribellus maritimus]